MQIPGDHSEKDFLHFSGYNANRQCEGTDWWYSRTENSAFTLNKRDGTDSTNIIHQILVKGWSAGALLFETAALYQLLNILQVTFLQSAASINCTKAMSGCEHGFSFKGNIPDLNGYATQLSTDTSFVSIDGGGFFI